MRVLRTREMTVYNLDKQKLQQLNYPSVITMSDTTDKVAETSKKGDENLKFWSQLIMSAAHDLAVQEGVMSQSSQAQGGFLVKSRPDDVAFFECAFKPSATEILGGGPRWEKLSKEYEKIWNEKGLPAAREFWEKELHENFGFSCHPITHGMIGPNNWLYGHYYNPRACEKLYDRMQHKVVDRSEKDEKFPVDRYYCAVHQDEVDDFLEKWNAAMKRFQEYDDIIRFNWQSVEKMPLKEKFGIKEFLMTQLKEEKEKEARDALAKFEEYLAKTGKYESSEEFRKLFKKRYGELGFG